MKLTISCMDRRLNEYLDTFNDGKTLFLRNAGGNVINLKNSIRNALNENNITEAKVIDHTDCGAMKVVKTVLDKEEKVSENVERLIELFKGYKGKECADLEKANEVMQGNALKEMVDLPDVKSELLDINTIKVPKTSEKHVAVITNPTTIKYESMAKSIGSELFDTYFIQASTIEEIMGDIEIANKFLHIADFVLLATDPIEYRQIKLNKERLEISGIINGNIRLEKM